MPQLLCTTACLVDAHLAENINSQLKMHEHLLQVSISHATTLKINYIVCEYVCVLMIVMMMNAHTYATDRSNN
jgi:hypothetical protein